MKLETISKSFSQTPYYEEAPFTSYNVLAQANGFNSLYVYAIPIFDSEKAVLPLSCAYVRFALNKVYTEGNRRLPHLERTI